MKNYKELDVWQQSMNLAETIYRQTAALPAEERYGLTSQIRRAAVSIPANIAEGWGRETTRDYIHFLTIARGSLMELETHLLLCSRLNLLPQPEIQQRQQEIERIGKMLNRLISALKAKIK
jgi:four helix bundle protein